MRPHAEECVSGSSPTGRPSKGRGAISAEDELGVAPRVFISYSHDTPSHCDRVLALARRLRDDGVNAIIDKNEQSPPQGWPFWCEEQIRKARFVLMVCTETYFRQVNNEAEAHQGHGVLCEARLIRQLLYDQGSVSDKFVPVLFADSLPSHVPTPVKGATIYDIDTPEGYEALYRLLTNRPSVPLTPLGPRKLLPPQQPLGHVPEHRDHPLQQPDAINQPGGATTHVLNQTINVNPPNEIAKGSGDPKPDWNIRDLFYYIRPAGFSTKREKDTVGREVLDRFSDGQLKVWGRLIEDTRRRALTEIPKDQWQRANFGSYWFLDEGDNTQVLHAVCETPARGGAARQYAALKVNRTQATSIWIAPQRLSVLDFFAAAEADGWVFSGKRQAMHRLTLSLRELGLSETVEIWGRQLKIGWDLKSAPSIQPLEKIEPSYFRDHWIDVHQAWMHKDNVYTRTSLPAGNEPSFFSDLYIDRVQGLNWLQGEGRYIRKQVEEDPRN